MKTRLKVLLVLTLILSTYSCSTVSQYAKNLEDPYTKTKNKEKTIVIKINPSKKEKKLNVKEEKIKEIEMIEKKEPIEFVEKQIKETPKIIKDETVKITSNQNKENEEKIMKLISNKVSENKQQIEKVTEASIKKLNDKKINVSELEFLSKAISIIRETNINSYYIVANRVINYFEQ